jgi:hypothetical protein
MEPTIDLMALAAIDRETEVTYIRRERDWLSRALAEGRVVDQSRLLPMLPPAIGGVPSNGGPNGNGHAHDGHGAVAALGPGGHD